jgi:thiol-disulfide isomerase/thioredoxin
MRPITLSFPLFALASLAILAAPATAQLTAKPAAPAPAAPPAGEVPPAANPSVLIGDVTRAQVEAAVPDWVQVEIESKPDAAAAQGLLQVAPGADVTVYFGTWCGDSRREVSRLFRALDAAAASAGTLPFPLRLVAVDEAKQRPEAAVREAGLRYVPTFVVRRDGHEIGRIVEVAPHGIEVDLLALLTGKAKGLQTASPHLAAPPAENAAAPHSGS